MQRSNPVSRKFASQAEAGKMPLSVATTAVPALCLASMGIFFTVGSSLCMATGKSGMAESSSPFLDVWLESKCLVKKALATERPVHCGQDCDAQHSCAGGGGVTDQDPTWAGGCAWPCCGFSEWYSAWRLQPLCGEEHEVRDCFDASDGAEAKEVEALWCSTTASVKRFPSCNQTLSRDEALANARTVGPEGDVVPCFFNELRTDIKLRPEHEEVPLVVEGVMMRAGIYFFFGALMCCFSTSCFLAACGMGVASVSLREKNRQQKGSGRGIGESDELSQIRRAHASQGHLHTVDEENSDLE